MTVSTTDKRRIFRELHRSGCFAIPNPYDVGTARYLQHLKFKALATTSSGAAWSLGLPDTAVGLDRMLDHLAAIATAADVPVNADFEGGYAIEPEKVAANVTRAVATGVSGLSIEDSTGAADAPLFELPLAVARIRAARQAIDAAQSGVVLTGRAECFLVGRPDLEETIQRLVAYAEAGADCLYAPGLRTAEDISAVVKAVAPKPVNVLMGAPLFTLSQLADLGVRRVSVGGALARVAWGEFVRVAKEIAEHGSFGGFSSGMPFADINGFFAADMKERGG